MPSGPRFRSCLLATVLAVVLVASAAAAPAPRSEPASQLARRLSQALALPQLDPTQSAALALDLVTGAAVFRRHPGLALAPASTEKLAVTYGALVVLGPSFRTQTAVLGDGIQHGSLWRGNLVLKGHGDPTLSTGDLRTLAARIRSTGITRVTGRVLGDESFFDAKRTAPGWRPYFFLNESPPLSALTVDRARSGGTTTLRPALAAAALLTRALRTAGVTVNRSPALGRARPTATPLASIPSPALWSIVRFMDRESDNFTAELLVKQLGALYGGRGSTAAGAAVLTRILAADGIPLDGVRIVDGSGLSRLNRMTAAALVGILKAAWASPVLRKAFVGALPVSGRSGTLRHRMRRGPARGRVFAKTGTTSEASTLSGFVSGRFAFAVLQNGHPVPSWWARQAQDRFAAALASAK